MVHANQESAPYLRLHHANVFVRDQDRSLSFFLDQLGFNLVVDLRFQDQSRFVVVAPPDGTAVLALIAPTPDSELYQFIGRSGHVVFVSDDVDAQFRRWSERGVRFHHAPRIEIWGVTVASFEDCDGNAFMLVGWDDMTRQVETQRLAAAEKLESERRAAQELTIAKQVQARLFPQTKPALTTLEYAGICTQAREVGGDYYDFLNLGRDRLGLVIADVSGKGMSAALLMANLQANLRSQAAVALDQPQRFLQSVNELFFENTSESVYATLFFAEYDDRTRRLRFANCGHLSAILVRHDQTFELLSSTATVVGLFRSWDCSIEDRLLVPGDLLVLYTDGLTEASGTADEEFGEQRLIDVVLQHQALSTDDLLQTILKEVRQFSPQEQQDDMTIIVAKVTR